jgi:hypothetical protein
MTYAYMTYVLQMRAPRGADSKRDATTNPNPDFIRPSNFELSMPSSSRKPDFAQFAGAHLLLERLVYQRNERASFDALYLQV